MKKATFADLVAVPGISENKARQILEYIRQAEETPALSVPETAAVPAGNGPTTAETSPADMQTKPRRKPTKARPHGASALKDLLEIGARETVAGANALLRSDHAEEFGTRLARQLGKLVTLAEHLEVAGSLKEKEAERATALFGRLTAALADALARDRFGRKYQERLADTLRDGRRKLEAILPLNCEGKREE